MDSPQHSPRKAPWPERDPERTGPWERVPEKPSPERLSSRPPGPPTVPEAAEVVEEPGYGHGV